MCSDGCAPCLSRPGCLGDTQADACQVSYSKLRHGVTQAGASLAGMHLWRQ